jgi:hypothetical protein
VKISRTPATNDVGLRLLEVWLEFVQVPPIFNFELGMQFQGRQNILAIYAAPVMKSITHQYLIQDSMWMYMRLKKKRKDSLIDQSNV